MNAKKNAKDLKIKIKVQGNQRDFFFTLALLNGEFKREGEKKKSGSGGEKNLDEMAVYHGGRGALYAGNYNGSQ